ncbi:MAG: hypothetical protein HQ509_08110 [Candidatus Marinimicrobia bacterium]|nr:hypothetical protein [Candidatus Neomarinimicrobiota bacterium]
MSCSLWEYEDKSDPFGNQPPETYLSLVAADTIYVIIEDIIVATDTLTGITTYDTVWNYSIGIEPPDTAMVYDTLGNAFTTITTSQQLMNWWGEDQDGNVVAYDVRWNTDSSWTRTHTEDSVFYVPIRTALDVFQFFVRAVDDSGTVDPTPAMLTFPIRNSSPEIEFRYGSNPLRLDHGTVSYTFPTRTFTWDAFDLDGIETIINYFYALDDTCDTCWNVLDAQIQSSITLTDSMLSPGNHTFYLKALDVAGAESNMIRFPDSLEIDECQVWTVMPVIGNTLLVDDFPLDPGNEAQDWYSDVLETVIGTDQHSIWEIGDALPYSTTDLLAYLSYFDHVVWYTAYTQNETYNEASSSILSFVMNGGNFFISATELKDTSFVWFPIESHSVINPSGRFFPGRRLVSQVEGLNDLVTSYTIGVRVRSFIPDGTQSFTVKDLFHLQEPGSGDEWTGTPNVCSLGQFQIPPNEISGKVVLLSLPLHNGSVPLMEGDGGSATQLVNYLFTQEFVE